MLQVLKSNDDDTDLLRLNDLAKQHGLRFCKVGRTYQFNDYTAHGLEQALGFAEGFNRAKWQGQTFNASDPFKLGQVKPSSRF